MRTKANQRRVSSLRRFSLSLSMRSIASRWAGEAGAAKDINFGSGLFYRAG
jgi:hypothetical protein